MNSNIENIVDSKIEDFAQLLMDSNPQFIFWKDTNGVYLGCNKLYAGFCGLENTESIIGTTDFDCIDGKEARICVSTDKEVIEKGNTLLNFEECITDKHGVSRWYSVNKIPLKNNLGEIVGVLGTMTDVTELKNKTQLIKEQSEALEKQLEELTIKNKELKEFNYIVAHDLQEPIRNILNFGTLVERGKSYDEEFMGQILSNGKRMSNLLNAMLDYSVLDSRQKPKTLVDLKEVAQYAIDLISSKQDDTKYKISIGELPKIQGYKEELTSLFQNIICNSIKYRDKNRFCRINIKCIENTNNKIQLCIEDNGIGFEMKQLDKVMQIFQRLHHRDEIDGMGIGLSICSKVMKMHNGILKMESKLGIGTNVFLTFNS